MFPSTTVAVSGAVNAELTVALCGVPPVAAMAISAPVMFVSLKSAAVATPETVAATVYDPAVASAVKVDEVATPLALVVSVSVTLEFDANVPLAPLAGAVNVTDTPVTGFELLSTTVATSGAPNAVLIVALCSEPPVAVIDAGGPDVLFRLKVAVVPITPATEAVTGSAPMIPLAVKVDDIATPLALVVSVSVLLEVDANVPLAPVDGAVKTTNAPLNGFPPSVTVATSGAANAVLS
jgi:hypothetical protein